jgi:hypothetical protein
MPHLRFLAFDSTLSEAAQKVRVVNPGRLLSEGTLRKCLAGVRLVVVVAVGLDGERQVITGIKAPVVAARTCPPRPLGRGVLDVFLKP